MEFAIEIRYTCVYSLIACFGVFIDICIFWINIFKLLF